ncbi:hexokinase-2-like [Ornithodoros turicata]
MRGFHTHRRPGMSYFPQLSLEDPGKQRTVENILSPLLLSAQKITKIRDIFKNELELGLQKNPKRVSSLQMELTYLPELPNGTEKGEFLALDLGPTNVRVMHILLDAEPQFKVKYYTVPEAVRLGQGEKLFDYLAECIHVFLQENELLAKELPLGFCFSFPMTQKALDVGLLVTWTTNYNCSGVVGKDVVLMLKEAVARRGDLNIDIVAIVNDATGTLVKGAFLDPNCAIGLILGTGSNACYLEKLDRIEKWEGERCDEESDEVVIDIEWGAFGDNGVLNFIKTDFDKALDENSLLVNSFTFEKLFSGKHLGELVRIVLVKLVREKMLFEGRASETILTGRSLKSADISQLEGDDGESRAREIFARLGYIKASDDDIAIARYVCGVVSARAAQLVSICLAVLLERMQKPTVTIAIDGSVYKHHPRFHTLMTEYISTMAPNRPFKLMLAEDGSGKGAGLVAAVADRLRRAAQRRASAQQ